MTDPKSSAAVVAREKGDRAADYITSLTTDYRFFIRELWREKGLAGKSAPPGPVELDMADFGANGPRLRGILGFRGLGKSHFITGALPLFRWLRDRNRRVFVCSKSDKQAMETGHFVRGCLDTVWFLRHLRPEEGRRSAISAFDIAGSDREKQPSWSITGITGNLEGNRGHTVIPDDIETKANSTTTEARAKLRRLANEFINFLYPDKPFERGGPRDPTELVFVGTPKHEQTLYLSLIESGFAFQSYPIQFPQADEFVICLAPILQRMLDSGQAAAGDPVVPDRFPHSEIARCMAGGRTEFLMEFMLVANLAARTLYPLRLSDLIVFDLHRDHAPVSLAWGLHDHNGSTAIDDIPCLGFDGDALHRPIYIDQTRAPYTGTKMALDPAGRGDDKTGVAVVSQLAGMLFLKHWAEYDGGSSSEALDRLALCARDHNARDIYFEDNADTLGAYRNLLEVALRKRFLNPDQDENFPEGWSAAVIDDTAITHAAGVKEIRICNAIEPVSSTHRLVIDRTVAANPAFQQQFTRIRRERNCLPHEHGLDALALCLRAWTHALSQSTDEASNRARKRDTTAIQLEKLRHSMLVRLGLKPAKPRWFQH